MAKYAWKGIDCAGKTQKGELESESVDNIKTMLLNDGVALLSVKELCGRERAFFSFFKQEKNIRQQQVLFFSYLSTLLKRGIELRSALELSKKYVASKQFKSVIAKIIYDVENGTMFSAALREYPIYFDNVTVNIICAGEASGKLDIVLGYVVAGLKMRFEIAQKIKHAALLPGITLAFSLLLILGIFVGVIPQFESLFQSAQSELPASTRFLLAVSNVILSNYILLILAGIILLIVGIKCVLRISAVAIRKDKVLLSVYGIGSIIVLINCISFSKTLSVLLDAGIPLKDALEQSGDTINNIFLRAHMLRLVKLVEHGSSLEQALKTIGMRYIPENFAAVVAVGEKSGNLGDMIAQSAEFFSNELSSKIHTMTTLFQPILLLIVGVIVAFIMVSIYVPIFTMANVIF